MNPRVLSLLTATALLLAGLALAGDDPTPAYRPADSGQRPGGGSTVILPEKFLRGFDPISVYFRSDRGPGRGPADGGEKLLTIKPAWPGAWFWLDRKTLQFRPAEPWPALSRFQVKTPDSRQILTTMMAAPMGMSPSPGSTELKPFRTLTLTFPQALDEASLRKMIRLQERDQPGLADSPRRDIDDFAIAPLPRRSHRDPAVYAITLNQEIGEGKQLHVNVSLALGDEDKVLWTGRLSTRLPFHLAAIHCGGSQLPLRGDVAVPRDLALACGNTGETPQLVFSAPVRDLTLTNLKKLVKLDPAVAGLAFESYGKRVVLRGKFVPDVLYRLQVEPAPVTDDVGRKLEDPGQVEAFFYLGWKQPFVRWKQARAILEAKGPRMIPLVGYGEPRVDLRIFRVDALHRGLWPFPASPVFVDERADPPFPGEEPKNHGLEDVSYVSSYDLQKHLKLLGSPLISRVVDLPLADRGATTHFGLNVGPMLDQVVGRNRPGHYLVGLRRLTGPPQRAYVRIQVTDLTLTSVEERNQAVFYVRSLSSAQPVGNAELVLEVVRDSPKPPPGQRREPPKIESIHLRTDGQGKAVLSAQQTWRSIHRIVVRKGEDVLVIDPRDPPPRFANNHWSPWGQWLQWISGKIPPPVNDKLVGFLFTERPIYRPGEKVFIKGFVRRKVEGRFVDPGDAGLYMAKIRAPGGKEWIRPVVFSGLRAFDVVFEEPDAPTGVYLVSLMEKKTRRTITTRSFQIEAYRIPKFEVQMVSPEKVSNDRPFDVKAVARYYAGGSVSGQPVEWTVTRRPYYHVPKGRKGYLFASSLQFSRDGRVRPPETIREEDTLSDKGADTIRINPALDMDGSARIYRVEATVTGADNQIVSAVSETKALPPFVLGMKLKRYFEKPVTLKPEILAIGFDDKPVAGQKVKLRLFRRTWHSHLRETDFATGKASYVTEQQDKKLIELTVVSGKKAMSPALKLDQAGVYVVELTARDKLGRVQSLSADLYVGGKEAIAWKKSSQGIFELSTDKKKYQAGDTAKLIIKSPFQTGQALVIIEEPDGSRHQWLSIKGGKAVQSIPITSRHVPNLPVHVVIQRGRLGQGGDDDARYRPRTLAASKDLEVDPVSNQVRVDVKFPEMARPGATVNMTIRLSDENKRPLSGEVTLWLVDEAVLSLAKEGPLDPLKTLITRNQRTTSVRDTRNRVVGRLREQEEPAGDGGEGADKDRLRGKRRVRKNFQTVPYYKATLQVNRSGRLVVPVKLSDDLTNFQVRAVAVSGMERFGNFGKRLKVRLPVIVQPLLPRFVRQGDRFLAGGIGRLVEGKEGPGRVLLTIDGDVTPKDVKRKADLRKNKAERHTVEVTATTTDPTKPGQIRLKMDITRISDGVGDAFEVKLPVLPDRQLERFGYFLALKSGKNVLKALPEKARSGTVHQELLVTGVPGVVELLSGIDYLAAYPHGCLEQRMSKLVPQMQVAAALKKLGLNKHYALQVGVHVTQMLEELKVFQDDRGFFAFWPGGEGRVGLTAQAVELMAIAKRYNHPVNEALYKRSIEALKRVLRSDFTGLKAGYRFNQQTAAIKALTLVGELDEHYLIDLFHHLNRMDLSSMADLALSMNRRPALFTQNLPALRKHLWSKVVFQLYQGKKIYKGLQYYRSYWGGWALYSSTSTLAAVFESLVQLDPKNKQLDLLRDALLASATAERGFGSTYDNRRAIQALMAYVADAETAVVNAKVAIAGDGTLKLGKDALAASTELTLDAPPALSVTSDGMITARVLTSYLPDTPGDRVEPKAQGFIISRRSTVIPKAGGPNTHFEDGVGETRKLASGDILEIEARLVSQDERHHVAFVVPFAAGLEPLNPALKTAGAEAKPSRPDSRQASYVQRMDNELRFYFTVLPKGTHTFYFRLRATTPGSFVHPAPWAEQMYHQETRGRGAGMRIEIAP